MKTLFRFHRGTLEDSLKTTIEVKYLNDIESKLDNIKDLTCEFYVVDDRLPAEWGSDTYIVCGTYPNGEIGAIGMSNALLKYRSNDDLVEVWNLQN